jgi:uncharacterized protein with von Willebrand factor type A (vWA) domain
VTELSFERLAVDFAEELRAAGVAVATTSVVAFVDAVGAVGLDVRSHVYWAGRATLVHRPEDFDAYDDAFATFWLAREQVRMTAPVPPMVELLVPEEDSADAAELPDDDGDGDRALVVAASSLELLRAKDLAALSAEEFDEARRLMAELRLGGALRRSRRLRRARRGDRLDVRGTVRASLRTGGEPVRRAWRRPAEQPRRVVLLCDVSGSMEPYARSLLRFAQAAVAGRGRVEAFALGTRLTRITRQLAGRDPEAALSRATHAAADWGGGTRLGDGLRSFNDEWGVRGMARGAVVVILSDGWDRGDPAALAEQMGRLRRVAHKVVWVNPLRATPGYAPLARGMAAALPYVDEFVDGHSLQSLEDLVKVVAR